MHEDTGEDSQQGPPAAKAVVPWRKAQKRLGGNLIFLGVAGVMPDLLPAATLSAPGSVL